MSERADLIQAKSTVLENCTDLLSKSVNYDDAFYDQHKAVISEFMRYLTHEFKIW